MAAYQDQDETSWGYLSQETNNYNQHQNDLNTPGMTDSKVYCNSASMTTVIIDLINAEAGDNAMLMYEHTLVGNVELTPFVL